MEYVIAREWIHNQLRTESVQWTTLEHNGVMFEPPYVQHHVPLIYDGKKIYLTKEDEEYATLYAKLLKSDYVNNKLFNKNFWNDWKKKLKSDEIKEFDKCDFTNIYNYLMDKKASVTKEEKEERKRIRNEQAEPYKYAYVDGIKQPVGNYMVEPMGIFLGRGDHPNIGKVKRRITYNDVTLNLGEHAKVPNGKWKAIVHDHKSQWIASYNDTIIGKLKYFWLGQSSSFKSKNDFEKFELARKLKKKIKHIRAINEKMLLDENIKKRQIATALYFIDHFALRVGNEKGADAADTVGVTSLRIEHIDLLDNYIVKLDFLGKDSIRYVNKVKVSELVYNNLKEFMNGKEKGDDLFDKIRSNDVNKYLQEFMKGLTAKVFRTYNASNSFQKELDAITKKYMNIEKNETTLLNEFNKANAKVAILCNHQKKVSKKFPEQIEKMKEMYKKYKKKLKQLPSNKTDKIKKILKMYKNKIIAKTEQKNISLSTSKINYIDPRITMAFIKKHGIDKSKVFAKTQIEKFKWAENVDSEFKF